MELNNNEMYDYKFGKEETRKLINVQVGDFNIYRCPSTKLYIIKRINSEKFDGTEGFPNMTVCGNAELPETLNEKLETCMNIATTYGMTKDDFFVNFDYKLENENKMIIIYPARFNKITNYKVKMYTDLDWLFGDVVVSVGTRKKCRKRIK